MTEKDFLDTLAGMDNPAMSTYGELLVAKVHEFNAEKARCGPWFPWDNEARKRLADAEAALAQAKKDNAELSALIRADKPYGPSLAQSRADLEAVRKELAEANRVGKQMSECLDVRDADLARITKERDEALANLTETRDNSATNWANWRKAEVKLAEATEAARGLRQVVKDLLGDSYITEEGSSLCFFCQTGKEGQTDDDDLTSILEDPENHAVKCPWRVAVELIATPAPSEAKEDGAKPGICSKAVKGPWTCLCAQCAPPAQAPERP